MSGIVYFDIETCDADLLYAEGGYSGPFVRLCGWGTDDGFVGITSDTSEFLRILEDADTIIGHDVFRFDLPALARHCGADYERLAAKTVDTIIMARHEDPPTKPQKSGYYKLDTIAKRLGVPGKTDDLARLSREFAPKTLNGRKLTQKERESLGYGLIPQNNPEYAAYLRGDIVATREVYRGLLNRLGGFLLPYLRREMKIAPIQNRMTLNGWRVDKARLAEHVAEEEERRRQALKVLAEEYGVPLTRPVTRGRGENKTTVQEPVLAPLNTAVGKDALIAAFQKAGAPFHPTTATGGLATSSDALGEGYYFVGKGRDMRKLPGMLRAYGHLPEVRRIVELVNLVTGASAKYAEIAKFVTNGRVHGGVGESQVSGRWAMTRPSITNLGKRGEKVTQREVFLPDEGEVLLSADFSQLDMRAVAALSGDKNYAALFAPGKDAHAEIAEAILGDRSRRQEAKPLNHGWNYNRSNWAISEATGIPLREIERFDRMRHEQYPRLCAWQDECSEEGASSQFLDNGWGRKMRCDPRRAKTQSPALKGQGCARDVMCEGLLRAVDTCPDSLPMLRAVVHDEVVVSCPISRVEEISKVLVDAMTFEFMGVPIVADVSSPGANWALCYAK